MSAYLVSDSHIEAIVYIALYPKFVPSRRCSNKLPDSRGLGSRILVSVEVLIARFDQSDSGKFSGGFVFLDHSFKK